MEGCSFFAYSWKLPAYGGAFLLTVPAYGGAFLLTVDNFSFFAYNWSFFASIFCFLTYSWSFFAYSPKVRLIRALRDCKQRSFIVSKKAPTASEKASPIILWLRVCSCLPAFACACARLSAFWTPLQRACPIRAKPIQIFGSPQMWFWPQLVFWRVPPIPHCDWRTLPQAKPLPSPPSPSLFPPPPLGSFCKAPGGGGPGWWGAGVLGHKGVEGGGGLQAALGARPTSGGTRNFKTPLLELSVFRQIPNNWSCGMSKFR